MRLIGMPADDRFLSRITESGDCWLFDVNTVSAYKTFKHQGREWRAHRWSYTRFVGPIPDGLQLDHTCENKSCVRPEHLEPVTNAENQRRRVMRAVRCKNGHDLTAPGAYRLTSTGARFCKQCRKDKQAGVIPVVGQWPLARFNAAFTISGDGCWLFNDSLSSQSRGRFFAHGRMWQAHIWSYAFFVADVPDGLHVDHLCRVPQCVNPDHLEAVTPEENLRRCQRETCSRGHPITVEPSGVRSCSTCRSDRKRTRRRAARGSTDTTALFGWFAYAARVPVSSSPENQDPYSSQGDAR